jgi:hypothetical protein
VHGDRRGGEPPAELARREGRLAAIGKAKADLEAEHAQKARVKAEQAAAKQGADDTEQAAAGDEAASTAVVPAKAQWSFTGPESRIMKTSNGSVHYCYHAQTVVDEDSQVILNTKLVASGADCPELPAALEDLAEALAAAGIKGNPKRLLADAGYFSEGDVAAVTEAGIDPLIDGRPPEARREGPGSATGADPEGLAPEATDDPHAAHQEGPGGLRPTQSDRRTGLRADESRARRRTGTATRTRQHPR